jgi:cytochrome c-type biogenesis protein CcmH
MKRVLFCLMALCIAALPALQQTARAGEAAPTEFDPGTHKRVLGISQQLRCLVCQNQSIADSNAELAVDLRNQVVAQIKQGRTDKEIISYMVERYGDFVLYNPPLKASTVILWVGPAVLFFVALIWGYVALRRRKVIVSQTERRLTAEEKKRAEELLRGGNH